MRKFRILEKMFVNGYGSSEWEEVGTNPSQFMAESTDDAIDKFLDLCEEDFRWCENLHIRYVGDLCEVHYTEENDEIEIDFAAEEIINEETDENFCG